MCTYLFHNRILFTLAT